MRKQAGIQTSYRPCGRLCPDRRDALRILRAGQGAGADQDRLLHGADRTTFRRRQAGAARHEDLGGGDQRQGRAARAPGQAHLLRRSDQCLDRARHLHQAHRRRQGRPYSRALWNQHGGASDACRRAKGQDDHHLVRARCEPRVQIQQILRHDPERAGHQGVLHGGLLRCGGRAEPQAADGSTGRSRCGIRPQQLRRRARKRQEARLQGRLRQDVSASDHGLLADRACHPGTKPGHRRHLLLPARTRSAWSRR